MSNANSNREKAAMLVRSYGHHLGADLVELDANDDRSFGEVGFKYDAQQNVLTGRVFIAKLNSHLLTPDKLQQSKQAMLELNGPLIVPLFERVGARFEFDQAKDILFLKKDFPVDVSERQLRQQMDELSDVGAKWVFRWLRWAMQIIYGKAEPPGPPLPVTRANDAQHNEFQR